MRDNNYFMNQAYKEAIKAYTKMEVPVGAVIVKGDTIVARGHNKREISNDPTEHAEISAIRKASRKLNTWRLSDCDLYVTLEPCPMCAGAIIQARIKRVIIGTMDPKSGCAGSLIDIFKVEGFNHKVEVDYAVMQEKCAEILTDFFKKLRNKK